MSSLDQNPPSQNVDVPSSSSVSDQQEQKEQEGDNKEKREELLKCGNCGMNYKESENDDDCCEWYSTTHKGKFLVNWKSKFWLGWEEHLGPPDSSFCRQRYSRDGGYKWSICGCEHDRDECRRISKHKPKNEPLSDDDEEIPYVTSDEEQPKKRKGSKRQRR